MRLHPSFYTLQIPFATKVAGVLGIPLGEAFRCYTTFYSVAKDNDAGLPQSEWDFDPSHPAWVEFLAALAAGVNPAEYIYSRELAAAGDTDVQQCFGYDYWPDQRCVRLHFGNSPDGLALRAESWTARREELRRIFLRVAEEHPESSVVRGTSWLYHLPAYRRLFPGAFVDNLSSVGYLHQFTALWGQFLDRFGVVKPQLGDAFTTAVAAAKSMDELNGCFTHDVLATTCDIGVFYAEFGIA
jgi:hypothetical protein